MGKSGPKPSGKLEVLAQTGVKRPDPLPGMSESAKEIWNRITGAFSPDYFRPQHLDLLRVFCESAVMHETAVARIESDGAVIVQKTGASKRNPWCQERDACATVLAQLGTKLNITKNAEAISRNKAAAGQQTDSRRDNLLFKG